ITAISAAHHPMSSDFEMTANNPYRLDFYLDPLEPPQELRPEFVATLQRDGFTLIQGFVVSDEAGTPLPGVRVSSSPGGAETHTDGRGFFRFYVAVQAGEEMEKSPANLVFHKP